MLDSVLDEGEALGESNNFRNSSAQKFQGGQSRARCLLSLRILCIKLMSFSSVVGSRYRNCSNATKEMLLVHDTKSEGRKKTAWLIEDIMSGNQILARRSSSARTRAYTRLLLETSLVWSDSIDGGTGGLGLLGKTGGRLVASSTTSPLSGVLSGLVEVVGLGSADESSEVSGVL